MPASGYRVSVSGCGSIIKKKIELYREHYPDVQLFFSAGPEPGCDLLILPAETLGIFLETFPENRLLCPPIIAYGEAAAMQAALASGCVDYLCSPWSPAELFERAHRCFRSGTIHSGLIQIICSSNRCLYFFRDREPVGEIVLSHSEYSLFILLNRNRGCVFSREGIAMLLPGRFTEGSRAVDMHISRLRGRIDRCLKDCGCSLEDNPIKTASGQGWSINP